MQERQLGLGGFGSSIVGGDYGVLVTLGRGSIAGSSVIKASSSLVVSVVSWSLSKSKNCLDLQRWPM